MCASCIARVTAAQATRSPRNFGKMMPRLGSSMRVAGSSDALHAAGDRRRRLDLDDEIDGPHVDAELERRRGDERRDLAGFQRSSISIRCARAIEPWCARTSGSPASSFSAAGQPLGDRRLLTKISVDRCALNQLEQPRMDRRSRSTMRTGPCDAGPARDLVRLAQSSPCPRPELRSEARAASSARCRRS